MLEPSHRSLALSCRIYCCHEALRGCRVTSRRPVPQLMRMSPERGIGTYIIDRIAVHVTSPENFEKLLGTDKIERGMGETQAATCVATINLRSVAMCMTLQPPTLAVAAKRALSSRKLWSGSWCGFLPVPRPGTTPSSFSFRQPSDPPSAPPRNLRLDHSHASKRNGAK